MYAVLWIVFDGVYDDTVAIPLEFHPIKTIIGDVVHIECIVVANKYDTTIVIPWDSIFNDAIWIAVW